MITAIFILIVYVIVAMYFVYQIISYKDFLQKNSATTPQSAIALTEQQKRDFLVIIFSTIPFTAFKINLNDTYWVNLSQWRSTIAGFVFVFLVSLITIFVLLISNF